MAKSVPAAVADRLLINRIPVRGPEMERLFAHIDRHPGISYEALVERYVPDEPGIFSARNDELLKETIGFMLTAGLLELETNSNAWSRRTFQVPEGLDTHLFTLVFLARLRAQTDPRQRALAGIHDHLVSLDLTHVPAGHAHRLMERSPYAGLFAWNEEKIRFWSALYGYVGLMVPLEDNGAFLVPRQELLRLVLGRFARRRGARLVRIRDWLDDVEAYYFACYTAKGRVHRGLAFALEELADAGWITFRHQADAARSVLIGARRVSDLEVTWDV